MDGKREIASYKDKTLFTPGPLSTSLTVKLAMSRDIGSRDFEFIGLVSQIREGLVELACGSADEYVTILMQGSGTFGLEAVISSTVPAEGKFLIIINGAYGKRLAKIASVLKIDTVTLECSEDQCPDPEKVRTVLKDNSDITNVAIVHCETTTGIINPIGKIGEIVKGFGAKYIVDAMSSFGAVPINISELGIDYLVSSANKCIEGVPGFAFVIARLSSLKETEGFARSLCLNLLDQYLGFEKNGQFRFTPPTHALLAFHQAMAELRAEGGVVGREGRYRKNYETLVSVMRKMGFTEYLKSSDQGCIITSFRYPADPNFNFNEFYEKLNERDYVIYPGKVSNADCFRIGNIGRIFESDVKALLCAIKEVLCEMNVKL